MQGNKNLYNAPLINGDQYAGVAPPTSSSTPSTTGFGATYQSLAQINDFKVKQSFKIWEALTQGCCEQQNVYKVYSGQSEAEVMILKEESSCCNRCFCSPMHTYKVGMFSPYESPQIVPKNGGLSAMTDRPVLIEREGCCSKLLCCFSCSDTCANHADVLVTGTKEAKNFSSQYRFEEKICNGCTPEINIIDNKVGKVVAVISGPTIFGGCSEFCMDYDYFITSAGDGMVAPGDIAHVEKKKPEGCIQALTEAFTDVDNFELHFNPNNKHSQDPDFKAVALAALVYLDFMFFEFDNGMCEGTGNGGCRFTLFNCYCYGCICPCQLTLEKNDGGSN